MTYNKCNTKLAGRTRRDPAGCNRPALGTIVMWTKICGIRSLENARRAIAASPDAVGLNFYPQTPRCVDVETAKAIIAILPESITPVGLFVNHVPDEVNRICEATGITTLQLHGDEPPEVIAEIAAQDSNRKLIRAFRVDESGLVEVADTLAAYKQLGVTLTACLIDARVSGKYGGSGETAPWDIVRDQYDTANWPPLILAGGLTPDNVADAIATVHPWGVDVAGGVESSAGEKDAGLCERFVTNAQKASGVA